MKKTLRQVINGKLAEYSRLRRTLLFVVAIGPLLALSIQAMYHNGVEPFPTLARAIQLSSLIMAGFIAALLAIFEDNSSDATKIASDLEEEMIFIEKNKKEIRRKLKSMKGEYAHALEMYQLYRSIGQFFDSFITAPPHECQKILPFVVSNILDLLVERKGKLLGVGNEKWTLDVYLWNADTDRLEMLACRRWSRQSEEQEHRSWRSGKGHVGLAFAQATEQVCGDANDSSINGLIAASGENYRDSDATTYVSFASIPIEIAERDLPIGVLVATSSHKNRYLQENQEIQGKRNSIEVLRSVADALATILALAYREGEFAQQEGTEQERGM